MWVVLFSSVLARAAYVQADLHLDTPTQLHRKHVAFDVATGLEAGLVQLQAGGTNVAVEVLWPPRNAADPFAHTLKLLTLVEEADSKLEAIQLAKTPAEARAIVDSGKIALLLSLEGAHGLDSGAIGRGDWKANLEALHARGLRLLGLTWSFSNRFAGSSGDSGGGLTPEGKLLVQAARAKGILLDLSHASSATTIEVCRASPVPVIASHSNAKVVADVPRNLTDEEIECIARTGGVIGVNFHATFAGTTRDIAAVASQADHIAKVGGFSAVALGSDFDGIITVPKGLEDASKLGALWDELRRRGWTEEQIAGMRGENFFRAWSEVVPATPPTETSP